MHERFFPRKPRQRPVPSTEERNAALQRGDGGGIFSRQPDATDGPFRRIQHHTIVPEPCENDEPLIEYVDEHDRPLLIAPSSDAFPLRKKAVCGRPVRQAGQGVRTEADVRRGHGNVGHFR